MKKLLLSAFLITGMVGFAQEPETTDETKKEENVEVVTEDETKTDATEKESPVIKDEKSEGEVEEPRFTIEK